MDLLRIVKKFGFRMHKFSWVLLIVFLIFSVADFYSTFSAGHLKEYLEFNPIYLKMGWWSLIIYNFIALYVFLWVYSNTNIFNRFAVVTSFVYLHYTRFMVIINNFKVAKQVSLGEITKEMVEHTPDELKIVAYSSMMTFAVIVPVFLNLVTYLFFKMDHKIIKNNRRL